MKAVLFWDIDGTLLTTARAGIYALEQALQESTGIQPIFRDSDRRTYGR